MIQRWPVRRGRPYQNKIDPVRPLMTDNVLLIHLSQLLKAVQQRSLVLSAPVRRFSSIARQGAQMRTLSCTSAVVSVVTK